MPAQAEFDESSKVVLEERPPSPPNPSRMQSAMFKDHPDCWPMIRKAAHRPVRIGPGQLPLIEEEVKEDENA